MKKSITTLLVFCTAMLIAQDIAGTYRATAQRVEYQFYTRPNDFGLAGGNADGSTNVFISDTYGLGIESTVLEIPVGYNFADNIVGPIGIPEMDAMQYFLYVDFREGGNGDIVNSQVLASETDGCETSIQLLPLDDDLTYSSDLNAGLTVQSTMVTGQPNWSPYVGQTAGSWSISGSSFFSFFPATPSPVLHTTDFTHGADAAAPYTLYGDEFAACYATCLQDVEGGTAGNHAVCGGQVCAGTLHGYPGAPYPGLHSGYVIENPETSFAPSNVASGTVGDLHVEWHYVDGPTAETGLGDIVGQDEDGDGTDWDNILGYPALSSTFTNPACGLNYPVLGDVTASLPDGCVDLTAGEAGIGDANLFYVMGEDYAPWGGFLTWNAVMYGQTGDQQFLADDSASDVDPADIVLVEGVPFNPNGGKMVMKFEPQCIPVISSISVQGELTKLNCDNQSGDVDGNGLLQVNDVIIIVGHVLGNSNLGESLCIADVNVDGNVDVLDVVAVVQTILNPRGENATSATFTKSENSMSVSAEGIVGAVQITLSHGSDFSIELTDDAFIAESNTEGNTTTLMIVNPNQNLFKANGDFNIEEIVAATTDGYITTNIIAPNAIELGEAYPNPFNP